MKKIFITVTVIVIILLVASIIFFTAQEKEKDGLRFAYHKDASGISFEYPIGWNRFGKIPDGFMLNSPDEKSILIISQSGFSSNEDVTLDQVVDGILVPFQNDQSYNLVADKKTEVGGVASRDITFSYRDEKGLLNMRLSVIGKHKGFFHYFTLYSRDDFEKDTPDFEQIIKSIKFN